MLSSRLQFQNVLQISRKVSLFIFFYKYCISTRKSTSLLFEYCRCHSGFGPPRSKSASEYGPPFADLNPLPNFPFKHPLYHTWSLILFASFFVDVLFNHNTTFLNKGKKKTAISFQFYRIYYSESYSIRKN